MQHAHVLINVRKHGILHHDLSAYCCTGNADLSEEDGKQIESAVQSVLDEYRAKDVAASKAR